ncbi:MAG: thiamine pyrophosphate-binding protein [Motiliproteus sp.]|nr:thiamine pyrophosphate-binding protein [Motiliproteus sp.]MCW9053458.1 thiamine pyrophosphate-binding protein [Motiliproteus sp.]
MKASDAITRYLEKIEVEYCFELIGGMITHLIDSLAHTPSINLVSMHHEQAAAFAAEGYARVRHNQKLAVALGTSGPGATNLMTGIGSCWFDSIPCLFITGQVNTHEQRGARNIRQQGFQELDIVSAASGITKYSVAVEKVEDILPTLHKAVSLAMTGRPGPVLIDLPNDLQRMDIDDAEVDSWLAKPLDQSIDEMAAATFDQLQEQFSAANKPLVCFGGGAIRSERFPEFVEYLKTINVPYVASLMGMERLPKCDHHLGMIGSYGHRSANYAIQNCDFLLVVGSRLDVRQTGADTEDFARGAVVAQVDIDSGQLENRVAADLSIHASSESLYANMLQNKIPAFSNAWISHLKHFCKQTDFDEYANLSLSPHKVLQLISELNHGEPCHYVMDVGNNQMWGATCLNLSEGQTMHHSGGMGAMGFSLPAAIGVALGSGERTISINGDGGLQINLQELDTVKRLNLDTKIIVFNNACLGMVKNFQDMYFEGNNQSTLVGYSVPDFVALGRAFGLESHRFSDFESIKNALPALMNKAGPMLLEFIVPDATDCRPRLSFGKKLDEQLPELPAKVLGDQA